MEQLNLQIIAQGPKKSFVAKLLVVHVEKRNFIDLVNAVLFTFCFSRRHFFPMQFMPAQ